jgi:HEAT repeat protein
LLAQLADPESARRRQAALDLGGYPQAAEAMCARLSKETDRAVIEAIFTSLIRLGGQAVVEGLIPLLRSEDASLRNHAVEALQDLPDDVGPHMEMLLGDNDSDVRIFAINILANLHHPMAGIWLGQVLELDDNVNVCTTAVDVLAEVGTPDQIPGLEALPERFEDDPYVRFAVDTAISRIRGDE